MQVAIVGAGPFGLSVAATIASRGGRARVFGVPMRTWREHMPVDMLMRSAWEETSLWAGDERGTIDAWASAAGEQKREPLPLRTFLRYSEWFRERFVSDAVEADVRSVAPIDGGYRVETEAGDAVDASSVVVAVGVTPFAHAPPVFAEQLGGRVRFAVDEAGLDTLAGHPVAVIGGGQAAIETAGLAARAGAHVELLARSPLRWFADREPGNPRGPLGRRIYRLAYPAVGYGPPGLNRVVLHPDLFAALPAGVRARLNRRLLRPGASPWLHSLVDGHVRVSEGVSVRSLDARPDGVRLNLSDGSTRDVSVVLLGTGYRFQLDRLAWLAPELRGRIEVAGGWPVLERRFRSTAPGLYFVGYPAEGRFGPISRFVLGTRFTAERIAEALP